MRLLVILALLGSAALLGSYRPVAVSDGAGHPTQGAATSGEASIKIEGGQRSRLSASMNLGSASAPQPMRAIANPARRYARRVIRKLANSRQAISGRVHWNRA